MVAHAPARTSDESVRSRGNVARIRFYQKGCVRDSRKFTVAKRGCTQSECLQSLKCASRRLRSIE